VRIEGPFAGAPGRRRAALEGHGAWAARLGALPA
jgi:hypothetical protein